MFTVLAEVVLPAGDATVELALRVVLADGKCLFTTEKLVKHATERPDVRLRSVGLLHHFGGEILFRAPHLMWITH